jgi:hypothetical protein
VISEISGSPISKNSKNNPRLRREIRVDRFGNEIGGTVLRYTNRDNAMEHSKEKKRKIVWKERERCISGIGNIILYTAFFSKSP